MLTDFPYMIVDNVGLPLPNYSDNPINMQLLFNAATMLFNDGKLFYRPSKHQRAMAAFTGFQSNKGYKN